MKPTHPVALFRLAVLGPLASRALSRGKLIDRPFWACPPSA